MRTSMFLLATLFPVGAAQAFAQAGDEFVARETAVWQAVKDKQLEAFTAALDTSFVGVYADGIHTRAAEVASVRPTNLRSFTLTEFATRHLDPRTTLLTYRAVVAGDAAGKDFSGTYWISSLWRKVGGQWKTAFHTEVKAP
jgi:hypothetical protein